MIGGSEQISYIKRLSKSGIYLSGICPHPMNYPLIYQKKQYNYCGCGYYYEILQIL